MRESGGRRVKRSVNLDVNSVCFCTPEMLERYKKIVILKEYIEQTEQKVQQYNQQQGIDDSVPVNGVHQTNLGVFRAYLELYLKNLPVVNSDLTYMSGNYNRPKKESLWRCISSPERKIGCLMRKSRPMFSIIFLR